MPMQKKLYNGCKISFAGHMGCNRRSVAVESRQRELLEAWIRAQDTPQQVAKRCRIVLMCAAGWTDLRIAEEVGVNRHTCRLWRQRFIKAGPDSLWKTVRGRQRGAP